MNPKRLQHPKRTGKNMADNGSKWITYKKRMAIYERDEGKCVYCQRPQSGSPIIFTLDHLVPTELGGTNEARNLVTCCKTCNSLKSKRTLKQFLRFLEANGHDPVEVSSRIRRQVRRKLKGYRCSVRRKNGNSL